MSQQFPLQPQLQGYAQASSQPLPFPASQPAQQQVKFYHSGLFGFASAVGRFQRDYGRMANQGWRVKYFSIAGLDLLLRRYVVVIYEK